jgi:hypothetical protein
VILQHVKVELSLKDAGTDDELGASNIQFPNGERLARAYVPRFLVQPARPDVTLDYWEAWAVEKNQSEVSANLTSTKGGAQYNDAYTLLRLHVFPTGNNVYGSVKFAGDAYYVDNFSLAMLGQMPGWARWNRSPALKLMSASRADGARALGRIAFTPGVFVTKPFKHSLYASWPKDQSQSPSAIWHLGGDGNADWSGR